MTLSPNGNVKWNAVAVSSMRPGPIARTSPSWGFSFGGVRDHKTGRSGLLGSLDLTTMRSSRGLMETDTCDLPFGNVEDGQERTLNAICCAIYQGD